jgi:outer membrane protein OmpA-like peptidoglycan-associated protein
MEGDNDMNRWLLTTLLVMTVVSLAAADTWNDRWGVGLEGGLWKQIHGDRDYSNVDQFAGLKLRHGLSEAWTLDLGFKYGTTRPGVDTRGDDAGFTFDSGAGLHTRIWQPSLTGTYRLVREGTWRPWVSVGAGVTRWDVRDLRGGEDPGLWPDGEATRVYNKDGELVDGHGVNVTAIVGLGTEIVASSHWSFDLGLRYNYLFGQDKDSVGMSAIWDADHVDANSAIIEGLVGVNYAFGNSDKDGDGIPNDRDADPDNPEDFDGYRDEDGAPDPDNDNDGVLDAEDGAPNDAEDRDGFQDADGVPDPDNDNDGVIDARDGAPDEAEDMDGFEDEDGVPDPDNDMDGVLDADDRCPDTPQGVEVDAEGCPIVEEIRADLVLEGVNFKSGSAELTPESTAVLDEVADSLKAWPEVRVEVGGYTDSSGPAELNRDLSQQRAGSVRQYLIDQGVEASRVTAVGYGEDRPIADNSTREGRAANRRVELKRLN